MAAEWVARGGLAQVTAALDRRKSDDSAPAEEVYIQSVHAWHFLPIHSFLVFFLCGYPQHKHAHAHTHTLTFPRSPVEIPCFPLVLRVFRVSIDSRLCGWCDFDPYSYHHGNARTGLG